MFYKKYFLILLLLAVAIITVTGVSASDVNETSDIAAASDSVDTTNDIALASANNHDKTAKTGNELSDFLSDGEGNATPERLTKMQITQNGNYLTDKVILVKLSDSNDTGIANKKIQLDISLKGKSKLKVNITTDADGVATYKWNYKKLPAGTYSVTAKSLGTDAYSVQMNTVKVAKKPLTLKTFKLVTTYASGKEFKVRLVDSAGKAVKGIKLKFKIYNGRKVAKTIYRTTKANGYATFKASKFSPGTHKVVISNTNSNYAIKTAKSIIKINKKTLSVLCDSIYGPSWGQIAMGAANKATKKLINKIKLSVKIYTGKKYKKYTLITGYDPYVYKAKGIAILETNKFSIGAHKVKISIVNKIYKGTKNVILKIPAGAKNVKKYTFILSNGKGRYVK